MALIDLFLDTSFTYRDRDEAYSGGISVPSFPATADASFTGHQRTLSNDERFQNERDATAKQVRVYVPAYLSATIKVDGQIKNESTSETFIVHAVEDPHGQGEVIVADCSLEVA
jgi:hypothetical protein